MKHHDLRPFFPHQIFSFISVGELFAPVIGGTLYEKAGYLAVAGVAIGILVVDFIMRLMVIEKKVAARYIANSPSLREQNSDPQHGNDGNDDEHDSEHQPSETDALLPDGPNNDSSKPEVSDYYAIPQPQPKVIRSIPILYCLSSPSLVLALTVALVQATLLASFDATVPTHSKELFGFSSLTSCLLFIPLGVFNVIVGPLAGWSVDRYGTKPAAVVGYAFLVPVLALLRIPTADPQPEQPIIYAVILGLCGVGLAVIGAPSIVEAGAVVEQFHKRNPDVFGDNGPYAQLYGLNSMVFSLGLSLGPVIAGGLKDVIGYGDMNAVLAAISGLTSLACYVWLGGRPRGLQKK